MDRRKGLKRSARRIILWWGGVFLALQAGLAFSLDTWLTRWRDPNFAAHRDCLLRQSKKHPGRPLVVVAGSSRTMNGVCPGSLPDDGHGPLLFNWGFPYHSPLDVAFRIDHLVREGPRPNAIIIEVVPGLLTGKWADPSPVPPHFHRWQDLASARNLVPEEDMAGAWRDARLLPWFGYRHNIVDRFFPSWQAGQRNDVWWRKIDEWGWLPTLATGPIPELRKDVIAATSKWLAKPIIHPDQARGLRHALETCRREGIPAAVLLMPESPDMRQCYGPGTRAALDVFLQSECREFGVELIDAREWYQTEELFCDGLHLVPEGARLFTARLADEVLPRLVGTDTGH